MEITYDSSSSSAQWRCQTKMLLGRPHGYFGLLIFPLVMTFTFGHDLVGANPAGFVAVFVGAVALWTVFFLAILWVQIRQRCSAPRICATRLAPEGVVDVTPDKSTVIPWKEIAQIRNSGGDIFFYRSGVSGVYVPRHAFADYRAGEQFYTAAQAARRGDYSQLAPLQPNAVNPWSQPSAWPAPAAPTAPAGVWPPPPNASGYGAPPHPCGPIQYPGAPAPGQVDWSQAQNQAKRDSKKQQLQMLRTVFIVPMFIMGMNHQHAAPGRAHAVLIFDLSVFIVCVSGLIGVWIAESRLKRR